MPAAPAILVTAFEPSGDALAAALVAKLRADGCPFPVVALGGPKLRDAGAELLAETTGHAVMLTGAAAHALAHRRRLQRLAAWLADHPVVAHVPVDSPAANWSICGLVRRVRPVAKVVHLVCPQVWAWATWRIHKLKRLTDHVLCILPFEPPLLSAHAVPATFVGPPRNTPPAPRLALLPGSRPGEIAKNWPTMAAAVAQLRAERPALRTTVAAASPALAEQVRALGPAGVIDALEVGRVDDVLQWSDAALVVSGTATLHTAARRRAMVILYNVSPWMWHGLGRWIIKTRTFTLPNLLAEHLQSPTRVPELVPHFGAVAPVVAALAPLLDDAAARTPQLELFDAIAALFADRDFAAAAAATLLRVIDGGR